AIADDGIPVGIALYGLILAKGFQEIGEGSLGDILRDDRFTQGNEDGMRGLAFVAGIQFSLPPVEQFERTGGVRDFVAEIIGPAAVGVDVVEMLVKRFGEKP